MTLNFKKNNLLIIMLLIFVILSCIIFINMSNVKESFDNFNSANKKYFIYMSNDTSYNYYKLDNNKYKYKLSSLPNGLVLESSNNVTSQNRNLNSFREKNILISYYNKETDISLLNINRTINIMLDISTIPITNPSNIGTMNMVFLENSGFFYDISNQKLSKFNMKIDGQPVIVNGSIVQAPLPNTDPIINNNPIPNQIDNNSRDNNSRENNFYNDFNLYLLKQGAFGSNYIPPIYNNFETAMNLPSNPIVNPINTMNPLDYANSLFGPNISPTMISNMCLNQNVAKVTDSNTILSEASNNLLPTLGNNNSNKANNVNNSNKANNSNNVNNLNSLNSSYNNINRNQNFMRESYPPYQPPQMFSDSIQENTGSESIPRPVLTDFSSFGM